MSENSQKEYMYIEKYQLFKINLLHKNIVKHKLYLT